MYSIILYLYILSYYIIGISESAIQFVLYEKLKTWAQKQKYMLQLKKQESNSSTTTSILNPNSNPNELEEELTFSDGK